MEFAMDVWSEPKPSVFFFQNITTIDNILFASYLLNG